MTAKGVARSLKNLAKGFSDAQIKVREATSNDPWGPSGTIMNEIAQMTYSKSDFVEVMDMIDRRLNDKGKNWRHVFKALLVLDYCIHVGSDDVVQYARENIYVIKTLKEFQHIDEDGKDVGANVRQKAKDITSLLMDESRLREERQSRRQMRDKMGAVGDYMNEALYGPGGGRGGPDLGSPYGRPGPSDEDRDLQRALEESRRLANEEERLRQQGDADLAKAINLSEEEAREKERRQREKLERENQNNLFGEPASSGTNPFPANQAFDSFFNPYQQQSQQQQQQQQQWPQATGFTNMTFQDPMSSNVQNTGLSPMQQQQQSWSNFGQNIQAQMTGLPQQAQYTGMAPFQTASVTGMMPTQSSFQSTQQPQPQQQLPQFTGATNITAASNNPFGQASSMSQLQQPQQAQVQNTGAFSSMPLSSQVTGFTSTTSTSFGPSSSLSTQSPSSRTPTDPRHAKLNALLAARDDGQDTFGNTGNLRIPYGTGFANSLPIQPTGIQKSNSTGNLVDVDSGAQNTSNNASSFAQSFGQSPSRNPFAPTQSQSPSNGFPGQQQQQQQQLQQQQFTGNFF